MVPSVALLIRPTSPMASRTRKPWTPAHAMQGPNSSEHRVLSTLAKAAHLYSATGYSHVIHSLDRNRLDRNDLLHLTGATTRIHDRASLVAFKTRLGKRVWRPATEKRLVEIEHSNSPTHVTVRYTADPDTVGQNLSFPNHCHGFLYFWCPPHLPPLRHEVRFRRIPSPEVRAFDYGSDLRFPNGMEWRIPLLKIVQDKPYMMLQHMLRRDNLISDTLLKKIAGMKYGNGTRMNLQVIHTTKESFFVDFESPYNPIYVDDGDVILPCRIHSALRDNRLEYRDLATYSGSAVLKFERSFYKGNRGLLMRVVKVVVPFECAIPNYDRYYEKPERGKLLMRAGRPIMLHVNENVRELHAMAYSLLFKRGLEPG
ncbi:uncharacterized protein LAESUDRAFT_811416 [Laetiporus sulphureus 93-53]|uniref:Uncharacterized protein n=1 Tax=Laetiporus sulphureus 93-53 TaxID=1314785 RepID=A0A165F3P4_9APHY|nr:uncharacterized protein LAESUDRAFT_811416 [Laetiporus sulphureus 93-53]KZT08316.1 hypothetical protein LAESUDRAFT_811416 [Laetiporus sulphureus 93-53]